MKAQLKILLMLFCVLILAIALTGCAESDDDDDDDDDWWDGHVEDTQAPRLNNNTPSDGVFGVSVDGSITLVFNESMDTESSTGQILLSHGLITNLEWNFGNVLEVGYSDLPQGTEIFVTVNSGITDAAGNPLNEPVEFSFWTMSENLALLEFDPMDGQTDINRATSIDLIFSEQMQISSLESEITISDDSKALIPFTVEAIDEYHYELHPADSFETFSFITVEVGTGVTSYIGNNLQDMVSFNFTTGEVLDNTPPTILSIDPPSGSTMPADQTAITMEFSEPMDPSTVVPNWMNGQAAWLVAQTTEIGSWNAEFTILTLPLPAHVPAGLSMEVFWVNFADVYGIVQTASTGWFTTVAGTPDLYPVSDGARYTVEVTRTEGELGSTIPYSFWTFLNYYQFTSGSTAGQWNLEEYEDPQYQILSYYDILTFSSSGVFLDGFGEEEDGSITELSLNPSAQLMHFPIVAGSTWNSSTSIVTPDGTLGVEFSVEVIGQENLQVAMTDGRFVTWTNAWKVQRDDVVFDGANVLSENVTTQWFAPGVGLVMEIEHEDNLEPGDTYWSERTIRLTFGQ